MASTARIPDVRHFPVVRASVRMLGSGEGPQRGRRRCHWTTRFARRWIPSSPAIPGSTRSAAGISVRAFGTLLIEFGESVNVSRWNQRSPGYEVPRKRVQHSTALERLDPPMATASPARTWTSGSSPTSRVQRLLAPHPFARKVPDRLHDHRRFCSRLATGYGRLDPQGKYARLAPRGSFRSTKFSWGRMRLALVRSDLHRKNLDLVAMPLRVEGPAM